MVQYNNNTYPTMSSWYDQGAKAKALSIYKDLLRENGGSTARVNQHIVNTAHHDLHANITSSAHIEPMLGYVAAVVDHVGKRLGIRDRKKLYFETLRNAGRDDVKLTDMLLSLDGSDYLRYPKYDFSHAGLTSAANLLGTTVDRKDIKSAMQSWGRGINQIGVTLDTSGPAAQAKVLGKPGKSVGVFQRALAFQTSVAVMHDVLDSIINLASNPATSAAERDRLRKILYFADRYFFAKTFKQRLDATAATLGGGVTGADHGTVAVTVNGAAAGAGGTGGGAVGPPPTDEDYHFPPNLFNDSQRERLKVEVRNATEGGLPLEEGVADRERSQIENKVRAFIYRAVMAATAFPGPADILKRSFSSNLRNSTQFYWLAYALLGNLTTAAEY